MSMLARVPQSRTTKDMDLAAQRSSDLEQAAEALSRAVEVDLGDHLTFRLVRSTATGLGENQPGVATRRYYFACIDTADDTQVDTVQVDLVLGPPPVGRPDIIEPANRLKLRRPLVTYPYRLYPVSDQIADKVCATMDTNYPGGRRSSRVKDLVDLVVLARTQKVDLNELRLAIATEQTLSNIAPFDHLDIPADWATTYPRQARGVPGAADLTTAEAAAYVAQLVDPALTSWSQPAVWLPGAGWVAPDDVEDTEAEVAADLEAGGDVYVRPSCPGWITGTQSLARAARHR